MKELPRHTLVSSMHRLQDRVHLLACMQLHQLREELQRDIHSAPAASGTSAAMRAQDTLHNSDALSLEQASRQAGADGLSRGDSTSSGTSTSGVDVLAESWEGIMQESLAATLQRKPLMLAGPSKLHENVEQSRLMTDYGAAAGPGNAGLARSGHLDSEAVSLTAAAAGDSLCPVTAQKDRVLSACELSDTFTAHSIAGAGPRSSAFRPISCSAQLCLWRSTSGTSRGIWRHARRIPGKRCQQLRAAGRCEPCFVG